MHLSSISAAVIVPSHSSPDEKGPEPQTHNNFVDWFFVRQLMECMKKHKEGEESELCRFDPVQMIVMQSMMNMSYFNA